MDTYVDFANVTSILPVGNTTSIDPTINTFESFIRMSLGTNTSNCNLSTIFRELFYFLQFSKTQ